jgi:hypothetical protein
MNHLLQVLRTAAVALGVTITFPLLAADDNVSKLWPRPDPSAGLIALDAANGDVVSSGPFAKVTKNLDLVGTGSRAIPLATTDVWAHDGYAYTGTFNSPCGGDPEAGIWVWDVHNANNPSFVGVIPSPTGSRSNDVKAAAMNSGDILVHSNESCAGGPGGFEIYNVEDPANPVFLARVQTDDVNAFLRNIFGFVDFGVQNLFLFTQGENDYVAAAVESEFGNFQIFDITDPTNPSLVGFWGAEQLHRPDVTDWANLADFGIILDADSYLFSGFGDSQNRFLRDVTINADGTRAYLANWDAGLILLDISDPTNPILVSQAIDPTSEDGEVNSNSVWPSEDGTVVVEGEEDLDPFVSASAVPNGWSGFRIWDYSDPANPVLVSTFNTVCSATVIDDTCDPAGTYSSHNVVVETTGNKVKAYVSWYDQGVVILDITDPSNPIETARYTAPGENFWGIYKEPKSPLIYGSDRNNGLVIFKEKGAGSTNKK